MSLVAMVRNCPCSKDIKVSTNLSGTSTAYSLSASRAAWLGSNTSWSVNSGSKELSSSTLTGPFPWWGESVEGRKLVHPQLGCSASHISVVSLVPVLSSAGTTEHREERKSSLFVGNGVEHVLDVAPVPQYSIFFAGICPSLHAQWPSNNTQPHKEQVRTHSTGDQRNHI